MNRDNYFVITCLSIGLVISAMRNDKQDEIINDLQARIEQLEQQPYNYGDQAGACNRVIEEH